MSRRYMVTRAGAGWVSVSFHQTTAVVAALLVLVGHWHSAKPVRS